MIFNWFCGVCRLNWLILFKNKKIGEGKEKEIDFISFVSNLENFCNNRLLICEWVNHFRLKWPLLERMSILRNVSWVFWSIGCWLQVEAKWVRLMIISTVWRWVDKNNVWVCVCRGCVTEFRWNYYLFWVTKRKRRKKKIKIGERKGLGKRKWSRVENVIVCICVESISGPEVLLREGLVSYPVHWIGR